MTNTINDIFTYHNETKHSQQRYARSLGYMDWATQPDPFRSYKGATQVPLPLSFNNTTAPYHLIFDDELPAAPLLIQSISQFFQFSLGIAAWKQADSNKWALRCNASSGNLQPSEAYIILPPLDKISTQCSLSHYAPKTHALEKLCDFDSSFFDNLEKGSFLVGLSSITWREVWKYGERAFRYCSLDAGHAFRALQVSAMILGWKVQVISDTKDAQLSQIFGFDQANRYIKEEAEYPDMLLSISPLKKQELSLDTLSQDLPTKYEGSAYILSRSHQAWEMIEKIEKASFSDAIQREEVQSLPVPRLASLESKELVLKRRSAQMMNPNNASISGEQFYTLLNSVKESMDGFENSANLVLFVHEVQGLEKGLYLMLRNKKHLSSLKRLMRKSFVFEEIREDFYLLEKDDFRARSKSISCNQDIAAEGAFSLGMLCEFSAQIQEFGAHRYKELYWECGAIGQQLYLEATALGISATGIGCYLDDAFHNLLGLDSNQFQSLYHFTIGRAIVDDRLMTLEPYHHLD
ncbi:SagB/ThcOx family dehydrogenase [Sulfurimonas sp. MAG313]|nr:SagB/ThcOx family dehydrogenase [Sulfurimonas sp. MAG313]MDF1881901.1 SagB/ThcOx family dehydrogenase [Sulfurimonas sp. MAG313]